MEKKKELTPEEIIEAQQIVAGLAVRVETALRQNQDEVRIIRVPANETLETLTGVPAKIVALLKEQGSPFVKKLNLRKGHSMPDPRNRKQGKKLDLLIDLDE